MKKLFLIIPALLFLFACDEQVQSTRIEVFSIKEVGDSQRLDIITEYGGHRFWNSEIRISLDDSVDSPKGIFWIDKFKRINEYRTCTLIFNNKEQAQEWLKTSSKITVNGNTNSDISVSHSESHSNSGCFISSVL